METALFTKVFDGRSLETAFGFAAETGYDGYVSNECHRARSDVWTDRTIAAHERKAMDHLVGVVE